MIGWTLGPLDVPNRQKAVEEIYHKYKRLMFATAGKFTTNSEDQEDIVQTVLERLVKIFSVSDPSKCYISVGYIVYMVRGVSIDLLRKQGREAERCTYMDEEQLGEIAATEAPLEELLFPSERVERLRAVWLRLSAQDRILLEGRYILDRSDKELAAIMGCQTDSVRIKMSRARQRIMKLLQEGDKDSE